MEMVFCTTREPPRFWNCGLLTCGGVFTMSCVGTPMQLASCGAPVKLPAPELEPGFGLDVHPAGRPESTSSAFLACAVCAVWAEVAGGAAGPATPAVESTAVNAPASDPATSSPAAAARVRTAPD